MLWKGAWVVYGTASRTELGRGVGVGGAVGTGVAVALGVGLGEGLLGACRTTAVRGATAGGVGWCFLQ
jgi:hypothetical protein